MSDKPKVWCTQINQRGDLRVGQQPRMDCTGIELVNYEDYKVLLAENEQMREDYGRVVGKFDATREALSTAVGLLGHDATPPDEYYGGWHDWLIEQVRKAAEAANED